MPTNGLRILMTSSSVIPETSTSLHTQLSFYVASAIMTLYSILFSLKFTVIASLHTLVSKPMKCIT